MRNHLEAMQKALYMGKEPDEEAPIVLAALRDRMLELAAGSSPRGPPLPCSARPHRAGPKGDGTGRMALPRADGPPGNRCRKKRAPSHAPIFAVYVGLPNYQKQSAPVRLYASRISKTEAATVFVDEIVAWGDTDKIRERIQAHWDAGANHVCIQAFRPDGAPGPDEVPAGRFGARIATEPRTQRPKLPGLRRGLQSEAGPDAMPPRAWPPERGARLVEWASGSPMLVAP